LPDRHHRRSIRLKGYVYTLPGAYFITVCSRDHACLFGHVVNGEMHLNDAGEIAQRCREDIPHHFPSVELDAMVIMPNHVHGVIVITGPQDATQAAKTIGSVVPGPEIVIPCKGEASVPPDRPENPSGPHASPLRPRPIGTQPGSLSSIVQNFKSISTRKMNAARRAPGTLVWQRNYYEHVVRNEVELTAIREYILGNPARWDDDENNPAFVEG
jgi:REP-associated tyrosine transposase